MKITKHASQHEEAQVDMTPMLDIVFIMLIFFIVTTSFVKPSGLDYNKPAASLKASVKSGNILVIVDKTGLVTIDKRQVDIERVTANIERLLAESPEATVLIQADKEVLHGLVVAVMDKVRIAGVEKISVAELDE